MYQQIIDAVNQGIVILSSDYKVIDWNRWMEIHSRLQRNRIIGTSIFSHYPDLSNPNFTRNCKSVLKFGNYIFYSQKLHNFMFPFKPIGAYASRHEIMQQSCIIAPLRDDDGSINSLVITVQDVTESVYLENELKTMSQRDSLTGMHNRRYFDERLAEEFSRSMRSGRDLSLIIFDIDDFKKLNDRYGHQYGDVVLKEIARTCSRIIRGGDILARYGGEEFCVILPESDLEGAGMFAERLRKAIENMNAEYMNDGKYVSEKVTVSLGVASINSALTSEEQLLKQADDVLYKSKQTGKNRVTLHQPGLN